LDYFDDDIRRKTHIETTREKPNPKQLTHANTVDVRPATTRDNEEAKEENVIPKETEEPEGANVVPKETTTADEMFNFYAQDPPEKQIESDFSF